MSTADASGASNSAWTSTKYNPKTNLRLLEAEERLRQAREEKQEIIQRAREMVAAQIAESNLISMSLKRQKLLQAMDAVMERAAQDAATVSRHIVILENTLRQLDEKSGSVKPGMSQLTQPEPTPVAAELVNTYCASASPALPEGPALPVAILTDGAQASYPEEMEGKTVAQLADDWALAHEAMRFTVYHHGTSYDKALNLHCAEYKNAPRKLQNATKEEKAAAACKFRLSYKRGAVSQVWELNTADSHFTHNHGSTKCSRNLMESRLRKYPELAKENLDSPDGSKNVQLRHGGRRKLPDGTIEKSIPQIMTMDSRALNYRRRKHQNKIQRVD